MVASLFPLQYLIAILALWLNRHQQEVIDYLKEENRMLTAKLGGRKLQFSDAERRRLAIRAKAVGRKLLSQLDTLVTPDTLLRWHRELCAEVELRPLPLSRSTQDQRRDCRAHCAHGRRQSELGLHPNSRVAE